MINRILINREECEVRAAFLDGQTLVELHNERFDEHTVVNNIYRGRVQDVVPGLQAAFIDVGLDRNLFLHFMDIRPESLVLGEEHQMEALRTASESALPGRVQFRPRRGRSDSNGGQADSPVKKGDQIIVQIVKDEIGSKAPRATTNLSLAGRYLVLLPFPSQEGGVSKKIAIGEDRHRLKKILSELRTDDYSFIVRTAGLDQPEESIRKDAASLVKLWESIKHKYKRLNGPGLIHNDHDLLARLVRDAFPTDFEEVMCDDPVDAEEIRSQLREHMPGKENRVKLYDGIENVFEQHGVEKQIEKAAAKKFWLKSGGYLIIDENEALTAIDINTGRFIGKKDQEKTSLKTNLEACEAIAQQIRLRDIGGIIVVDFIDMLSKSHQERVSEELKRCMKSDRAKTSIGKIGDFGLMVLTRKRQRMSLKNHLYEECPYCNGTGVVLCSDEVFRRIKYQIKKIIHSEKNIGAIVLAAHPRFIDNMTHRYRVFIEKLKSVERINIVYQADPELHLSDYTLTPVRRQETARALVIPAGQGQQEFGKVLAVIDDESVVPVIDAPLLSPIVLEESVSGEASSGEGKRRRRRRRRGRGRREEGSLPLSDMHEGGLPTEDLAGEDVDTDEIEDSTDELSALEPTAPAQEDLFTDAEPVSTAQEADIRRRTRRGSRGGRNRRKGEEQAPAPTVAPEEAAAAVANEAPLPAPPPEPPKIKLTLVKKSPTASLFGSVLDQLDKAIETLKTTGEAALSPAGAALEVAADTVETISATAEKIAEEAITVTQAQEQEVAPEPPAKKSSRRRTPAKKEQPADKEPAATKSTSTPKNPAPAKSNATKAAAKQNAAKAVRGKKTTPVAAASESAEKKAGKKGGAKAAPKPTEGRSTASAARKPRQRKKSEE